VIFTRGGLLIMMGQHARSESLFYYFKLDDYIPKNHLLRLIDERVSFAFVREWLKNSYSDTWRPPIDTELLLRMLLIGYLYGKRCGACSQKAQCTTGQYKYLAIHIHEPARQRARELVNTPQFANAQRQRKKVEALFAELKNQIGLRRLRLRRMKFVRVQFFLAAAAQNIKRLVRFLSQTPNPALPAAA
jgi:hypothetical protein